MKWSGPGKLSQWPGLASVLSRLSDAGVNVTEETALRVSAVFSCVRVLGEALGMLPWHLFQRLQPRGRAEAPGHPVAALYRRPNPEITPSQFKEVLQAHCALWGNAYAEKQLDGSGQTVALWPLLPDRTRMERDQLTGIVRCITRLPNGQEVGLPRYRVLHIPGFGFDGLSGCSVVRMASNAVGLAIAAEKFGAKFFGSGAHPTGVLEHPEDLGTDGVAKAEIQREYEESMSGLDNAHRILILEEGMKWHQLGIPPGDAQFLETRQFQVIEICRLFRIPPHMVMDLLRATFSNIEHQGMDFVRWTLGPWLVRWEENLNAQLLVPGDQATYYTKFNANALMRGDMLTRYQAYGIGRQWGWLSADDVCELEDRDPLPDGQGAIYLNPMNMIPAGSWTGTPPPPARPKDEGVAA